MSRTEVAKNYVASLYKKVDNKNFQLHTFARAEQIVSFARKIGENTGLTDQELEKLEISAWFSEVGFLFDYKRNEDKSAEILQDYLNEGDWDQQSIRQMTAAIHATRLPQNPTTIFEECLCDAVSYELGSENFMENMNFFKEELNRFWGDRLGKLDFIEVLLNIINTHHFFTAAAKELFNEQLEKNKNIVKKSIKKKSRKLEEKIGEQNKKINKLSQKYDEMKAPARGIETMFKVTSRNQITLSQIADNKANILITVCSIILSLMITMVIRKINEYPHMAIPSLALIITSMLTIIFAILSTRPKISGGKFTKDDIRQKKTNLLFFGNFYKMSFKEYEWGVREVMRDYDGLYHNMILDQYSLGIVLARKYRLLRKAYNIFMFGLTGSIILMLIIQIFFDSLF